MSSTEETEVMSVAESVIAEATERAAQHIVSKLYHEGASINDIVRALGEFDEEWLGNCEVPLKDMLEAGPATPNGNGRTKARRQRKKAGKKAGKKKTAKRTSRANGAKNGSGRKKPPPPDNGLPNVHTPEGREVVDQQIFDALKEYGEPVGASDLTKDTGLTVLQVRTSLSRLVEAEKVTKEGQARATKYQVA